MTRPAAVLFDCDGVLADSEGVVNRLIAEDLTARGWPITGAQCQETFLGMSAPAMVPVIEARVGPLPADWLAEISRRITLAMMAELQPIDGAVAAVHAVAAAGVSLACASNAARSELVAKLQRIALFEFFAPRIFSFEDVPRPKPAPDIYLAAAASCGADPAACVVVEDSLLGARAGIAAGCRVLGLLHDTDPLVFRAIGAEPLTHMSDLPRALGLLG